MSKRVIISEGQYDRIFLNEQKNYEDGYKKPPKDSNGKPILIKKVGNTNYRWNKHIGGYVHPAYIDYPEVPADMIAPVEKDTNQKKVVDKLFKDNIQNQSDGNSFREWVHINPDLLKRVNKHLKDKYGEGLDKNSEYFNNKFIKDAFNFPFYRNSRYDMYHDSIGDVNKINYVSGQMWVNKVGTKLQRDSKKKVSSDLSNNRYIDNSDLENYADNEWDTNKSYNNPVWNNLVYNTYKSSWSFTNYQSALSNWDKVKKFFGWSGKKSVNSENTLKILNGEIPKSTCIDPKYVWEESNKISFDLRINGAEKVLQVRNFMHSDLQNYFGDGDYVEPEEPESLYDKFKIEPYDPFEINNITPFINQASTTRLELPSFDQSISLELPGDSEKKEKERLERIHNSVVRKLNQEIKDAGVPEKDIKYIKDQLSLLNKYDALLDIIDTHNLIISLQSKDLYENACDDCDKCYGPNVVITQKRKYVRGIPYSTWDTKYFFRSDMCKNKGGIFLIPTNPKIKTNSGYSHGFNNDSASCCCVNPKGTSKVNMYVNSARNNKYGLYLKGGDKENANYTLDISVEDYCNDSIGDIRDGMTKFGDWAGECVNDWHCIADIVSIAALAFGPVGLVISMIADGISALGYVIEQDEGWKMNAGLTSLGVFAGLGDALSLAGKGVKFSKKLTKLGKIMYSSQDVFKLEKDIAKWAETLSTSEKLQYDKFKKLTEFLSTSEGKSIAKNLQSEMSSLTKVEQGQLYKIMKNKTPEDILKLYKKSGSDLRKMINTSFKGTKQVIIQGGLFAGVHVFSKEIGEWLKRIYDDYGFDPLGIFSGGEVKVYNPLEGVDWSEVVKNDPNYAAEVTKKIKDIGVGNFNDGDYKFSSYWKSYWGLLDKMDSLGGYGEEYNIDGIREKIKELHKVCQESIKGKGLDPDEINDKLSKSIDIYNKIEFNTDKGVKVIKDINTSIKSIKDIGGEEIPEKTKYAILTTGNVDVTDKEAISLSDLLKEPDEMKEEQENIKEEIKRMKSLFTEERLYGNLINESNPDTDNDKKINNTEFAASGGEIDYDEAYEFLGGAAGVAKMLQDKEGYLIKTSSDDDLCLRPGSNIKKAYDLAKTKSNIGFMLESDTKIGCALTIYTKDPSMKLRQISLFEGPSGNRFGMLIKVKVVDCCNIPIGEVESTLTPITANWNVAVNGYDTISTPNRYGLGLETIKVDGTWKVDPSNPSKITIEDGVVVKLLNKKLRGVPTKIKILSYDVNIPGFTNTGSERGGDRKWMIVGGDCKTVNEWVGNVLGGAVNNPYDLNNLMDTKM